MGNTKNDNKKDAKNTKASNKTAKKNAKDTKSTDKITKKNSKYSGKSAKTSQKNSKNSGKVVKKGTKSSGKGVNQKKVSKKSGKTGKANKADKKGPTNKSAKASGKSSKKTGKASSKVSKKSGGATKKDSGTKKGAKANNLVSLWFIWAIIIVVAVGGVYWLVGKIFDDTTKTFPTDNYIPTIGSLRSSSINQQPIISPNRLPPPPKIKL